MAQMGEKKHNKTSSLNYCSTHTVDNTENAFENEKPEQANNTNTVINTFKVVCMKIPRLSSMQNFQ